MSEETILTLEVLDFNASLLINKLYLRVANIHIDITTKTPTIKIGNFPINVDDYYVEKIELISNEKTVRYFRLRIYKNRHNFHNILLNELNNFSFEIGYFNKNIAKLPKTLDIKIGKNKYNLKQICQTDIPFINTFGIINCDKTISINEKNEIYLTEEKKGSFNVNFIASGENNIIEILKIHKSYYPVLQKKEVLSKKLKEFVDKIKNAVNIQNISKAEFSMSIKWYLGLTKDFYIEDYKHFIMNKIYPLEDEDYSTLLNYIIFLIVKKVNKHTESYPILKCFFNLLSELENKMENHLINKRDIISFVYYFYEHYCSCEKYKDCLDQKNDNYKDLYNNCSIEWIDFEIVFIKELKKESAYYKAVKLLENVLDNLKPNSKLLEILYFLDSGSGKIKNSNKTGDEKIVFNLSMISKENIISHIKNIIPNMIIRKDEARHKNKEPYAESDIYSGIITVYEKTLFKKNITQARKFLIDEPDQNNKYTITIFICLLHKLCSNLKLLIKDKKTKSPNVINDPYNNYKELELDMPESGRTMEYYISKDIMKIKFLKFSFSSKTDLYDHNLWTGENFENLNLKIENLMNKCNSYEYMDYKMGFFPIKKNIENKEIVSCENNDEIDWEFSSLQYSDDEENFRDKSDFQNKDIKNDGEFEINYDDEDVIPIVKY